MMAKRDRAPGSSVIPSDIIPKSKKRKQIHQSGIEMLAKCGVQFEFRYIRGLHRPPNAFLLCGKATDRAVDADLDNKIDTGVLLAEDLVLDMARDTVEKENAADPIDPKECDEEERGKPVAEIIGMTKDKAVRLVRAHHQRIAPKIEPQRTARKFSIDMDVYLRERARELHAEAELAETVFARRVKHNFAAALNAAAREGLDFVGEQDIVEHSLDCAARKGGSCDCKSFHVRDTKTSKKSPNEGAANESHQLTSYAVASLVLDGRMPDKMMLDYLIDLKKETKTSTLETTRTAEDVEIFKRRLTNAIYSLRSGIFVPARQTDWWCSDKWCGFYKMCPYVRRPVSVPAAAPLVQIAGAS